MKIFFHLILVFLLASNSIAQNDSKLYKQSFGFDVDIPRVLTNHVFNSKMYGVGEVVISIVNDRNFADDIFDIRSK